MKKIFFYCLIISVCLSGVSFNIFNGSDDLSSFLHQAYADDASASEERNPVLSNTNVDVRAAYGQYNNIFSSLSLAQNFEFFTYQLNSGFIRTDDYGFENSSYYEGELGFTGVYEIDELWKITPYIAVKNKSHGMHENSVYSREEKDKLIFDLETEYSIDPSIWRFSVSGAQYMHRFISVDEPGEADSSSFYKISEGITWEIIPSASNMFKLKHSYTHYFYSPDEFSDVYYTQNRAIADFKIFEYVKLHSAFVCDWNSDAGLFISGRGAVSSTGLQNSVYEVGYEYMLEPFAPEEIYFQQKFVDPQYNLPPSKIHKLNFNYSYDWRAVRSDDTRFELFSFKGSFAYEGYDKYYNYYTPLDNILYAGTVDSGVYTLRLEALTGWSFYEGLLSLGFNYEFIYYHADEKITYSPDHKTGATVQYSDDNYKAEWSNTYLNSVYVNPDSGEKLDGFVLGTFYFQKKIYETFFLYLKVDNLYDVNYSYRLNYPEPGITISAGLRIKY